MARVSVDRPLLIAETIEQVRKLPEGRQDRVPEIMQHVVYLRPQFIERCQHKLKSAPLPSSH